ncbi:helix-turn-helix domain-containing protein [Gluconacetobacter diazotrophicus]|uniref:helix-turn-helix domain-containing protein n=1 Tax=Gluconacetobacter diazotrophicus TaxID=33996 RepID=UPI0036F1E2D2
MTVAAAASIAGLHIDTLRKAIREGRLEAYRRPRATRVTPEALRAYMDLYLCPAKDQIGHFWNSIEGRGASSGGRAESASEARRVLRMKRALGAL